MMFKYMIIINKYEPVISQFPASSRTGCLASAW